MVEKQQLSAMDADALAQECARGQYRVEGEDDVLRWLAGEYDLRFTTLDGVDPDRGLLGRFPARILLKEEMLPLAEKDGVVEVALCRLFAAPGLDSLRALTTFKLVPVLAPSEALQREIKKHLGVGADTI